MFETMLAKNRHGTNTLDTELNAGERLAESKMNARKIKKNGKSDARGGILVNNNVFFFESVLDLKTELSISQYVKATCGNYDNANKNLTV